MVEKKYSKIISSIKKHTSLIEAFKAGMTPDDVKNDVINAFSPYFENQEVLEKQAVQLLVPELIEFATILKDGLAIKLFEFALRVHQGAKRQNRELCFVSYLDWIPYKREALSKYWSQIHLEIDKTGLGLEEFAHECLRNIGGAIEGSIKPYSNELLQQIKVFQGISITFDEIDSMDLGRVLDELIKFSYPSSFFVIENVRLNQWRNIAQHLSIFFKDELIVCTYGRPENRKEITLSREALYAVTQKVFMTLRCLKLASTIFGIDNLYEMRSMGLPPSEKIEIRSEAEILNLVSAIASQGFEVIDIQFDRNNAKLIVQDITSMEPRVRSIHASQFVEMLWLHTNSSLVTVEYLEVDGTPNLRAIASAELFERARKDSEPLKILAAEIEMIDLKLNTNIPKLKRNG